MQYVTLENLEHKNYKAFGCDTLPFHPYRKAITITITIVYGSEIAILFSDFDNEFSAEKWVNSAIYECAQIATLDRAYVEITSPYGAISYDYI